jgi:hypothetical protein
MGNRGTADYKPTQAVEVIPLNDAFKVTPHTAGVAATNLLPVASAQDLRRTIIIRNLHATNVIYVGPDNTVTTGTGWPIDADTQQSFAFGHGIDLWVIADGAGTPVRIMEAA